MDTINGKKEKTQEGNRKDMNRRHYHIGVVGRGGKEEE